jgi:hypothetical protein
MTQERARRAAGLFALTLSVFAAPVQAQQPEPLGSEFRVNSYTTSIQRFPAIARDSAGDFVIVWSSVGPDGSSYGIVGRRFDSGGNPIGSEFLVNSYTTLNQRHPAIAAAAGGTFVVVWESYQDGSGSGIFGRRFDSGGNPIGSEFQVNSYATAYQKLPKIATDAAGNFVVVWESEAQDLTSYGVFGRRFDSAGNPLGSDFQVNSYLTGSHRYPAIAADAGGNFVVVWHSGVQDAGGYGVFGRRFDSAGNPLGSDFQVNSYTTGLQLYPAIARNSGGSFVVAWTSLGQDGSYGGVFGRRFDSAGSPLGSEFRINSHTTGDQRSPAIALDAGGNFVVAWNGYNQDGSGSGVFGHRFDPGGSPLGSDFQINSYITGTQAYAEIATDASGNFVVVWESNGQDGSSYGVFGQRFAPGPDLIFADGFESGDLTHWSSAATDGTDLRSTAPAAMAGTAFGLEALVNDTNSLYVQDDTPVLESRYRARLYFDPNGFDPGEGQSHFRTRIFIVFDPSGFRIITLVLKRQAGAYSVETRVRRDDGTRADTGFLPISDGPHFIEFNWQRATAPGASDGTLEMWIDGTSMATLTGIDNDLSSVDSARMGAMSVKTGAAGTLYFDEFESRRQSYIGP